MSGEIVSEWIRKAEEDYEAAMALARKRKRFTPNAVGFHCQQCAEKYLKAYLAQCGVTFSKTHDLLELHKLCVSVTAAFELIGDLLDLLNPYAVEFRYPGEEATTSSLSENQRKHRFRAGIEASAGKNGAVFSSNRS